MGVEDAFRRACRSRGRQDQSRVCGVTCDLLGLWRAVEPHTSRRRRERKKMVDLSLSIAVVDGDVDEPGAQVCEQANGQLDAGAQTTRDAVARTKSLRPERVHNVIRSLVELSPCDRLRTALERQAAGLAAKRSLDGAEQLTHAL